MTNVVERRGIVISTQAGVARVRLSPAAGCAGCGTRNSCASAAAKPQIVDVLLPETALAALFVVFYAMGVSAGREATQQRKKDISMEHTHGGNE